jgi:hypothetical protein
VQLTASDLAAIESDVGGVLRFNPAPASLASVQVGSILVGASARRRPPGFCAPCW